MKRCFKLGAMAVACAAGVMISAGAANFTSSADRLHEVGLFQGTGTTASGAPQYDLDRAPTRAEAAVMLGRSPIPRRLPIWRAGKHLTSSTFMTTS